MRYIIITILIITLSQISGAQTVKSSEIRQVIIPKADTIIKVEVLTRKDPKIDIKSKNYYYWILNDRIQSNQGGYSGNLLHGKYEVFVRGALIESGSYSKGLKSGLWRTWTDKGKLLSQYKWKDGLKGGEFYSYHITSDSLIQGVYKNNRVVGKTRITLADTAYMNNYQNGESKKRKSGNTWLEDLFKGRKMKNSPKRDL